MKYTVGNRDFFATKTSTFAETSTHQITLKRSIKEIPTNFGSKNSYYMNKSKQGQSQFECKSKKRQIQKRSHTVFQLTNEFILLIIVSILLAGITRTLRKGVIVASSSIQPPTRAESLSSFTENSNLRSAS
jgi:hypothetical protein